MAEIILKATQILRNDSSANWSNYATKILEKGEPGVEFTSGAPRIKIGDGKTQWSSLSYAAPSADIYTDNGITYNTSKVIQIKHANGSNYLSMDGISLKARSLVTIDRPSSLNNLTRNGIYVVSPDAITDDSNFGPYGICFQLSNQVDPVPNTEGHWIWQLGFDTSTNLYFRRKTNTADWRPWSKIAFTSSDIEGNANTATTLKTSRTINGLLFNGAGNITNYTTSSTAGDVAAKVATLANFQLATGSIVYLRLSNTNTAANPTLNVNSTGTKAIQYRGAAVEAGTLAAGRTYCLVYDGIAYQIVGDLDTGLTSLTLADVGSGTSDQNYSFNGQTSFSMMIPQLRLPNSNTYVDSYCLILEVECSSSWVRFTTDLFISDSEGVFSGLFHWKVGTGKTATSPTTNYIYTLASTSTLLYGKLYSAAEVKENSVIYRLYLQYPQIARTFKVQLMNITVSNNVKINSKLNGSILSTSIVKEMVGSNISTNLPIMAQRDEKGNSLSSYIKDITSSGKTVTFTKGDGTTGTFTTQDTTYSTATSSTSGLTKLYTSSGTATDGAITQKGITDLLSNYILSSQKGLANGVAELDENGKVPSGQLPSYVDDVLECDNKSSFPATGETGKIYVDKTTNLTWRWGGSTYVEISPSLALGTTSSTAFRGDYGNTAYTHATAKGSAFSSGLYKITTNAQGHVTAAIAVTKADITNLGIPAQDTTYSAAGSSLGLVKTGGDVTISSGTITVNDNSHNHTISNVTGLEEELDDKQNAEIALINQNLDNLKSTRRYYGAGSNTVTNKPDDVDAFGLEVYKMASGYIVQEMTVGTPSRKVGEKYRRYYTTTWSSWTPLPILSATPTSGQVIVSDGTTGKLKTSGFTIGKSVPSNAVFTDTVYTLPAATSSVLGGVKIGNNITNTSGTISLTKANVVAALGYTPPTANTTYSAGSGLSLSGTTFSVKTGGTTSGKNYAVDTDDDGNLIVNVPWTDNNTTYTAGTGLTLSGTQFIHTNYGTAGTYGPSANATLTFGGTFTVPYVTTNAQGHVTASGARTFTMPANPNTDTKVTQAAAITTNGNYPIILGYSTATTAVTNTVNKASALTYNPSTKMLSIDTLDITPTSIANADNTIFTFDGIKAIFSANQFYPSNGQNLGASTDTGRWSNLYMKSTISFSNAAYLNSAGSTVNIGVGMSSEKTTYELSMSTTSANFRVNLYSSTSANLGQSANPWNNLYLGSSLSFTKTSGTINVTEGILYFKVADTILMQMAGNAVSFNGSSSFYPQQSTATLGDSSHQWKNVYVTEGLKYGSYNLVGFSDGTIKLGDSAFSLVNIASANGTVAICAGSTGPSLYPSGTMDLGLESNPWNNLYIGKKIEKTGNTSYYTYEGTISLPPAYPYSQNSRLTIKVPLQDVSYTGAGYLDIYLDRNIVGTKYDPTIYTLGPVNFSASGYNVSLGSATEKWGIIYSTSSTIQTSDRSEKTDIHYLDEQSNLNRGISMLSLANEETSIKTSFTTNDILSFIKKINPCTFVYKDNSQEDKYSDIESAIESNNTEYVQLGLIADDLKDEALFNFIGATMKYEEEVEPEQKDEEGNTIKEAVYETKTTLGLKAVPLAVSALTACKSLLETVDQLKQQISDLEYQVGYLKNII